MVSGQKTCRYARGLSQQDSEMYIWILYSFQKIFLGKDNRQGKEKYSVIPGQMGMPT